MPTPVLDTLASVNGVTLHGAQESLSAEELRQRASSELLRQAAIAAGLLSPQDQPRSDGVLSLEACAAIEALLEKNLSIPEPSAEACLRHYQANASRYVTGERVKLRHILFAVTPGVDVTLLRQRAEATLLNVRCFDAQQPQDRFAADARAWSNCPSGAEGGQLGWLSASDCAPEFAKELFGKPEVGVLPRLVHSRFGLHVVEVLAREAGKAQAFEAVRGAVAMNLRQASFVTALRQYLRLLAAEACIHGVELEAAETPLVQ